MPRPTALRRADLQVDPSAWKERYSAGAGCGRQSPQNQITDWRFRSTFSFPRHDGANDRARDIQVLVSVICPDASGTNVPALSRPHRRISIQT